MFNKLLSNLPFNPSLIGQVSFYTKRLHQETSIRRLGLVFVVFAMMLQLFAIIAPPQPTLARAGNDINPGGFGSKQEAVNDCYANRSDFRTIMARFGISCGAIAAGTVRRFDYAEYGGQLYTMGRLPYGFAGEVNVNIPGAAGTFYMRRMQSWGAHCWEDGRHCMAISGTRSNGSPFIVPFSCGNPVIIGRPQPPPPPPPPKIPPCPVDASINSNHPGCVPCPYSPSISKSNPACKPCDKSDNLNDSLACLELGKTARNSTRNILNADKTTARLNDVINYSLTVKNTGKATVNDFVVEENLTDVLEYANLIDLHGGIKDSKNIVRWPAVDIEPAATITKFITVKVKDKIPQTPSPGSDPGSFDLVMTNVYGKTINIKVPGGVIKRTEQTISQLPNTGPGTTIGVGFGITMLVSYFFARSRLMTKELNTVRKEYASSGGV